MRALQAAFVVAATATNGYRTTAAFVAVFG